MYLTYLSLTNFRNFARLDVDIPQGAVLLVGANAQGKTSLLEAVYYLATFSSYHASSDRQLINFLSAQEPLAVARIVAEYRLSNATEKPQRLEVRIIQEQNGANGEVRVRKEVLFNGVKGKIGELVRVFSAVMFLPQSLRVIEGAPEERRRYLNLTLSQVIPGYMDALAQYNHALAQRNALLKQLGERGGDPDQLIYWDEQLSAAGALLIHARLQGIRELEKLARPIHHRMTRGQEVLRLAYLPAYNPLKQLQRQYALPLEPGIEGDEVSIEAIRQGYLRALADLQAEEIGRGITTIGPHRDDLRFISNGIDLGTYGSRGQTRTAMLALKLAEVRWMKSKTNQWPVLLLDEVLAELDQERRADLLEHLGVCEQTLMATTDLHLFPREFVNQATVWRIEAGQVLEATDER